MTTNITRAAPDDAGCWIDGHWGQYGAARLVNIAIDHGFVDPYASDLASRHLAAAGLSAAPDLTDDEFEQLMYVSDVAEVWMDEYVAPAGFSFGWLDGEFFLQSEEWWAEECF